MPPPEMKYHRADEARPSIAMQGRCNLNAPLQRTKTSLLLQLLEQNTSLQVVSNYLKYKGLTHSASSWEQMIDKRLRPALESFAIRDEDLIKLLRDAEECGHQHVQLWSTQPDTAQQIIDRTRIKEKLVSIGKDHLLDEPDILDLPAEPQLTEVRWVESDVGDDALVLKVIETRSVRKQLRERPFRDNLVAVIYSVQQKRAVNVIKLHRDGLLEVRIASHSNSSEYKQSVRHILKIVSPILLGSEKDSFDKVFNKYDLGNAKTKLWQEKDSLSDLIRFSDMLMKNDNGNVVKAYTGKQDSNLSSDNGVKSSIDSFMQHNGYCDSSNFWFITREPRLVPTRAIHVLLTGDINEFILTARCTPGDYNYVLQQIKLLNS